MQPETVNLLFQDLIRDEDLRRKPYRDSVGRLSIGIGRNLDDKGISEFEAMLLCANDVQDATADLNRNVPWWTRLSEPRQRALLNMCFQLGWPRLSKFRKFLTALEAQDYPLAGKEALDSLWADQTDGVLDGKAGARAIRIFNLIVKG